MLTWLNVLLVCVSVISRFKTAVLNMCILKEMSSEARNDLLRRKLFDFCSLGVVHSLAEL